MDPTITLKGRPANLIFKFILPKYSRNGKYFFVDIPENWNQTLSNKSNSYKLVQNRPGPCGLFAILNAYMVNNFKFHRSSAEDTLHGAILDIMLKLRQTYAFCTDFKLGRNNDTKASDSEMTFFVTKDRGEAQSFLMEYEYCFHKSATFLLMVSFVFLAGPQLLNTFAFPEPFITQDYNTDIRFVLLLITGKAVDVPIDDFMIVGGILHTGVTEPQEIGFLKTDDSSDLEKVGQHLRHPEYKTWVIFTGGHFYVISKEQNTFYQYDSLDRRSDVYQVLRSTHPLYEELQSLNESS